MLRRSTTGLAILLLVVTHLQRVTMTAMTGALLLATAMHMLGEGDLARLDLGLLRMLVVAVMSLAVLLGMLGLCACSPLPLVLTGLQ
jgi:hypothetical protein